MALSKEALSSRLLGFYLFESLIAFQLWSPFWTLWLFSYASPFQGTLVDIVFWTVSLAMGMPAGAIADRYGRRPAIIVGVSIWVVGIVLFGLSTSLWMFALSNGIWAFGAAFMWGSTSAYLYDTLSEAGEEHRYPHIMARASLLSFLGTAIASVLAGLLVEATGRFDLPLLLYAVPGLLAIVVAATFPEPAVHRMPAENLLKQIGAGLRTTRNHRQLILIILFQVLIGVVTYVMAFFRAPFIDEMVGGNQILFGLVYGGFFCIAALAGMSIGRILDQVGESGALRLAFLLVFPPFILVYALSLGVFSGGLALGFGVLSQLPFYIIWGFEAPVITTIINRRVLSSDRATVLAISTFFTTLALAVAEPLMGLVIDSYGIAMGLSLLAAVAVLPSAYVVVAFRKAEPVPLSAPAALIPERSR